jgi:hypothetical protein
MNFNAVLFSCQDCVTGTELIEAYVSTTMEVPPKGKPKDSATAEVLSRNGKSNGSRGSESTKLNPSSSRGALSAIAWIESLSKLQK